MSEEIKKLELLIAEKPWSKIQCKSANSLCLELFKWRSESCFCTESDRRLFRLDVIKKMEENGRYR